MRVIIAGSRTIQNYAWLEEAIERSGFHISEVVSGCEKNGVDHLGEMWARAHALPVMSFTPDWKAWGLSAGPIRNGQMAQYAQAAIILRVPLGQLSKGSDDMYQKMRLHHKPVYRERLGSNGQHVYLCEMRRDV